MTKRTWGIAASVLVVLVLGGYVLWAPTARPTTASAEIVALQSSEGVGQFARVLAPRPFDFPEDHGPHAEYQTEWWYYTGNLATADGRQFGYQLTLFRRGLSTAPPTRTSAWASSQIYFAHFALTDVTGNQHLSAERFTREALGLAGAQGRPFRVWLENWEVQALEGDDAGHVRLRASDPAGYAVELTLRSDKPPTLQGEAGFSRKSMAEGNASYYVSFTRMVTTGTVSLGGTAYSVSGNSWMDHEWSTSVLGQDVAGWDWFSLQLSDGRELMYYQLRHTDGSIEPVSSGTLIAADGSTQFVPREAFEIRALGTWRSAYSGIEYPSGWQVRVASAGLDLTVTPVIQDQEMHVSFTYWEGAVAVRGTVAGAPVTGAGYVELTGYASKPPGW